MPLPQGWPQLTNNLQSFYDTWHHARGQDNSVIPYRRDLSLARLRTLTPALVILELAGEDDLLVRLSGTEIDAQFGRNLTGVSPRDVGDRIAADAMIRFHRALVIHPCAGFAHDIMVTETGKRIGSRYLILPLRNNAGEITLCASLCDAETKGFTDAPGLQAPQITYKEFVGAQLLDIGFSVPDFSYTIKTVAPLE